MILFLKLLLWISVFIVFYAYVGYGIFLWILLKIKFLLNKKNSNKKDFFEPLVTLIIPAYNEEDFIETKIENTLAIDYPNEKLKVIFVTDGSSDNTPNIISKHSNFLLAHSKERKGKIAAMNRVMKIVETPFVVFCDANTLLNPACIKEIVKHYNNPNTGGVAGEKKVISSQTSNASGAGENMYWKYESALKKMDSDFYTVVGAAGELFSFRTELYEEVEEDTLLDDFIISLRICMKGYRVAYEPNAYATETPSSDLKEEKKRKIRISAGGFQSVFRLKALLNIFKYPVVSFQYISHRVLRWVLCPFLLPIIFLLNFLIVVNTYHDLYTILLASQTLFYLLAILGWYAASKGKKVGIWGFPYYFVFINISVYHGFARFLRGNQSVIWEKAKRTSM